MPRPRANDRTADRSVTCLQGGLADSPCRARDTDGIVAEEARGLVQGLRLPVDLSARSARASYPALCEAVDQERRDGNDDHGADDRADDPAPVELVGVADAEYAVEDP